MLAKEIEEGATDSRQKFAKKDLEYPKLELILCRRGVLKKDPEDKGPQSKDEVIAYIDGTEGNSPCLTMRFDNLKAGEYFVLYRPDFKPWHLVKRLNVVFYSEFLPKMEGKELEVYQREWQAQSRAQSAKPKSAELLSRSAAAIPDDKKSQDDPVKEDMGSHFDLTSQRLHALSAQKNR